jgi:hypothetical protein
MTVRTTVKVSVDIEKADDNGYSAVLRYGDGQQRTACRTTLPEIIGWVADYSGRICQESPYLPMAPAPYQEPVQVPASQDSDPPDPELLDKARRFSFSNGNGRAMVAFLFCSTAALSAGLSGLG